jgi:hypothetical protein
MAAGLGFKDFVTGEVLTAADVDGYLMQGVWVFASAAARDAAVTSPQEGNFAYLKDTNVTTYYTGSAWANLDTTGMTNPMTTTGDTIYSSSGSTPARLAIGSTGNVLTVAGGVPTWAAPAASSSGMTLISRTEFSNVASQAFDGVFTSTYTNYLAIIDYIEAGTFDDTLHLQFRYAGPTTQTASYYGSSLEQPRTGAQVLTSSDNASQFTITADVGGSSGAAYGSGQIFFENVGNVSTNGSYNGKYLNAYSAGQYIIGGQVNVNRIYTGFLLKAAGSNITGAVSIYGLAKS